MAHLCNSDILSFIFIDAFENTTSSKLSLQSINRAWFDVDAPKLTDVRLDWFRAHHFEGCWDEFLTEPLSETARRLYQRAHRISNAWNWNIQCFRPRSRIMHWYLAARGFHIIPHLRVLAIQKKKKWNPAVMGATAGFHIFFFWVAKTLRCEITGKAKYDTLTVFLVRSKYERRWKKEEKKKRAFLKARELK